MLGLAVTRIQRINPMVSEWLHFRVSESWLRSAQVSMECGQVQEAYMYTAS